MSDLSRKDLADAINSILYEQDNQGYNVKMPVKMDYQSGILCELSALEALSDKYADELKVISCFIRRHIWGKDADKHLFDLLHRLNQVMRLFSDIIGPEIYWTMDTVFEYGAIVCNQESKWITEQLADKLLDDIQMANARVIISKQWEDVLTAPDGTKTFMDVFDDIFTSAIEKHPDKYIYSLKETDVLCRMVTVKDCDETRFIPLSESKNQNRWNPPGKAFLYMSYGSESHPYNADLTLEQQVCLLECRTEPGTDCSFCYFKPNVPGRIFDLSFNDVELADYRKLMDEFEDKTVNSVVKEMLGDRQLMSRAGDRKYIEEEIKRRTEKVDTKSVVEESTAKQCLKMICSCIYFKVDGSEEEKEKAYHSFHILSAYLQSKGITGIIYPCTRDERIKGKNIVLFDPKDASPISGSITRYYYSECGE